jgi:hypothetical protein
MIECNGGAERMANQNDVLATKPGNHRFEIAIEGPDEVIFGMFRIPVASEIERVDRSPRGHSAG